MHKLFDRQLQNKLPVKTEAITELWGKKFCILMLISLICSLFIFLFSMNNHSFYDTPIAKITEVKSRVLYTRIGEFSAKETYYEQDIYAMLENGTAHNKYIHLTHKYANSLVYDDKYRSGMWVFLEPAGKPSDNTPVSYTITGVKRDYVVIGMVLVLFNLLLAVGGLQGALTMLSLMINTFVFSSMLLAHSSGISLPVLSVASSLIFCSIILFFINGINRISLLSMGASLITIVFVTLLSAIAMRLSSDIDYEFLEYLIHPYHQDYADRLFLAEIFMGGTGVIIDISVAITSCALELMEKNPDIEKSDLIHACKSLGEDITGTMINVVFFTNVAACIPLFVVSLQNGIGFMTILRYNIFFEACRFLTGSIGILSAIPFSILPVYLYHSYHSSKGGELPC